MTLAVDRSSLAQPVVAQSVVAQTVVAQSVVAQPNAGPIVPPSVAAQHYSLEEYRALEVRSEVRHEYHNGVIQPVPGGTPNHNRITGILYARLLMGLVGQPFEPFITDMRVWIPNHQKGAYPDVFVVQKPLELNPSCDREALNPTLIAEVLSDSTEAYDRGKKFLYYQSIPSFREYLLISQTEVFITRYFKSDDQQWHLWTYTDLDGTIRLDSLGLEIPLSEIYGAIDLATTTAPAATTIDAPENNQPENNPDSEGQP